MGKTRWKLPAAILAALGPTGLLHADFTLYHADDTHWLSLGLGTRVSLDTQSFGAPDGKDSSKDFELESIRPTLDAQMNDHIKFSFDMDYDGATNSVQVLDALGRWEFNDYLNIWAGRFLPPSDRANLSGPYYGDAWDFPGVVQAYPSIFAGRDDGAAIWGQVGGGMFKWQVGAFDGRKGAFNSHDNLLGAGRLVLDLLDPEPGYYNSSTYYGSKKILALGVSGMTQSEGAGTVNSMGVVTSTGDFTGCNADLLSETPLGGAGTLTAEGAYYHYSTGGGLGLPAGYGEFATLGYLLPGGFLKPLARWQSFTGASLTSEPSNTNLDLELDYIVHGDNERYALVYENLRNEHGVVTGDVVKLGAQLVF